MHGFRVFGRVAFRRVCERDTPLTLWRAQVTGCHKAKTPDSSHSAVSHQTSWLPCCSLLPGPHRLNWALPVTTPAAVSAFLVRVSVHPAAVARSRSARHTFLLRILKAIPSGKGLPRDERTSAARTTASPSRRLIFRYLALIDAYEPSSEPTSLFSLPLRLDRRARSDSHEPSCMLRAAT
jgi:hypothetical protein